MKQILNFLADLAANNNREWFAAHKSEYEACRKTFEDFTARYIERLTDIEPEIAGLTPKDCIWRIYKDIRFSADKRPFKEWMGTYPAIHGGKKSRYGGYYVHLQPGHCMFAAGIWCPDKDLLLALRNEMLNNYDEVEEIMAQDSWKKYFTDFSTDWSLKRVPMGFPADFVHADWLKLKAYTFAAPLTDEQVCSPDFLDLVVDMSRSAKPMNDFLNYSV